MSLFLRYLFDRIVVPRKSPVSRSKEHTFMSESQPLLEPAVAKRRRNRVGFQNLDLMTNISENLTSWTKILNVNMTPNAAENPCLTYKIKVYSVCWIIWIYLFCNTLGVFSVETRFCP